MDLMQNLSIQNMIRGMLTEAKEKIAMEESKHQKLESKERKVLSSVSDGVKKLNKLEDEEKEQMKTAGLDPDSIEKLANALDYVYENFDSVLPKGVLARTIDKLAFEVASGPGSLDVSQARGGTMHLRHSSPVTPDAAKSTAHTGLDKHMGGSHTQVDNTHDEKPGDGSYDNLSKMPLQNSPRGKMKTAKDAECESEKDKKDKKKELAKMAKNLILSKLAGEDVAKANIKAERGPHAVGKGPSSVKVWDVSQTIPAPSSGGGSLRSLIADNKSAIDYTKRHAKRSLVREQSGHVWDEPAFRDPTLQDTFTHSDTAKTQGEGATKTATQMLAKIASMGCVCDTGECPYCTMVTRFYKVAGLDAMQAAPTPPLADPTQAGATDPAMMGQAPGRPDGCTCTGMPPLCKVCKLQMMLENMKQQQAGMPPQMGAAPAGGPPGGQMPPQQMGGA